MAQDRASAAAPASNWTKDWFAQPRADILAGIVVALALIPEAIGFALIAGVDPSVVLPAPEASGPGEGVDTPHLHQNDRHPSRAGHATCSNGSTPPARP